MGIVAAGAFLQQAFLVRFAWLARCVAPIVLAGEELYKHAFRSRSQDIFISGAAFFRQGLRRRGQRHPWGQQRLPRAEGNRESWDPASTLQKKEAIVAKVALCKDIALQHGQFCAGMGVTRTSPSSGLIPAPRVRTTKPVPVCRARHLPQQQHLPSWIAGYISLFRVFECR